MAKHRANRNESSHNNISKQDNAASSTRNGINKSSSRNKLKAAAAADKKSWPGRLLKFCFFSGIVGFGGFWLYRTYFAPDNTPETMSHILRNHINFALEILEQDLKMEAVFFEDPLAEIMKTELKPIQDRIASLKVQTSQYEKMEQIPGGPTLFIDNSLHELNTDIKEKITQLNTKAFEILKEIGARSIALTRGTLKLVKASSFRLNDDHLKRLVLEGGVIYPGPNTNLDPAYQAELAKHVSLEQVVDMASKLATLYEDYEKHMEKILSELNISKDHISFEGLSEEDYNRYLPEFEELQTKKDRIEDYKETNEKQLHLFTFLIQEKTRRFQQFSDRIINFQKEKREPFLKLRELIEKDIHKLKTRIDNLRYKYMKRSTTEF